MGEYDRGPFSETLTGQLAYPHCEYFLLSSSPHPQGFPGGSVVKNLPAMQKTWVRFLDREDPLEKEMATHSSILAWRIPWTEEPGGLQSMRLQELDMTE